MNVRGQGRISSLVRRARTLLIRDKEQFIRNLAEEVKSHFLVNDLYPAYQALRKLNSNPSWMSVVHLVDGRIILDHVGVCERWAEYFEHLHQVDTKHWSNLDSLLASPQ